MDDVENISNGFGTCLRSLSNQELSQLYLYFYDADNEPNHNPMRFNFRQAMEGNPSNDLSRALVCLFHFVRVANAMAARTLVDREIVRRFLRP